MLRITFLFLLAALWSCDENLPVLPVEDDLYFPTIDSDDWETSSIESLNWEKASLDSLYDYLSLNNTRAFLLLKDGKIVIEKYWGKNILQTASFDQNSKWYWASAGKTLTATLVGIAQQEGPLDINDKSSDYLGENWTSMPLDKEDLITVRHQLTMTTGLDYNIPDINCTEPACLKYKANAGNQWYYHNAPYTLLEKVVESATGISYNQFTDEQLENKIGMSGTWRSSGSNNVYWSKARDMARFGLFILNKGKWKDQQILLDTDYYQAMVNTSQDLNLSYGYLWWLNGKNSIIFPGFSESFDIEIAPNAPSDLFAAMGKNGQFIDIVPSKGIVVVRMGEAPDESLVPVKFHDEMWARINQIIER